MKSVTIQTLQAKKQAGEKFSVIAAYDATFSKIISQSGVDAILIGDSLGNVLQGHDSTIPVSVEDIAYHTACVRRGNQGALLIGDMPFMAYATLEQTLSNAMTLMQAGAHMVKMEGGAWLSEAIQQLSNCGVPVCGHLGLTPQSVNSFGGYKVQGRQPEHAQQILDDAKALEAAGAALLVLECVPQQLASDITRALSIPTIGIGAGVQTDAQVLVLHDLLGLNPRPPRFVKNFMQGSDSIQAAIQAYADAVAQGNFPEAEHSFE